MSSAVGDHAWRQCLTAGWAGTWPGAEGVLLTHARRISAWQLARYSAAWTCTQDPPTAATAAFWFEQRAPWPPPRRLPDLYRHWRWWRANLRASKVRRGDLRPYFPPGQPATPAPRQQWRLSLAGEPGYAHLVSVTLAGPTWTRRRLRRRTVTVRPTPPEGALAGLLWARHDRGDLTWAPPPPGHQRHVALRAAGVALLVLGVILLLGPILLMLFAGRSARRSL